MNKMNRLPNPRYWPLVTYEKNNPAEYAERYQGAIESIGRTLRRKGFAPGQAATIRDKITATHRHTPVVGIDSATPMFDVEGLCREATELAGMTAEEIRIDYEKRITNG